MAINFDRLNAKNLAANLADERAAHARTRAQLDEARERLALTVTALEACRPTIAEMAAPQMTYGAGGGCDPREFTPDPDASTEAERAQHAADCERAAKGEPVTTLTTCTVDGSALVSYQGWGLGTYTYTDEAAANALATLDAALAAARKEPTK